MDRDPELPSARADGSAQKVNEVKAALASADGAEIQAALERDGSVEIAGERLSADEVEVRAERHRDFALAQDGSWAVALDLDLDDDLRNEGTAREVVRAINDLRKEVGLELSDRISVALAAPAPVAYAVSQHRAWIAGEVLAQQLEVGDAVNGHGAAHELEIDGTPVTAWMARV